ncbi:NAD(P)H-dependent oxidoreductase [Actinoallomurus purpureus]|uniref:NADPH-dependent FMN reductase n=1 Tax=Actinoallomurus purpureus TaxID=478114 RepID=UPI002093858A|nr:NAD(P)H-dependent oxidoreductase [Actinoallomurus purpureus]MCO6007336.1 NAD(P)H-dependent oxidoreductase [Actinoallomurus purpureus]
MITVLTVSGSLRAGSTNSAVLRTASVVSPPAATVRPFAGMADLPHFNPDDDRDPLPPAVAGLRGAVGAADALLLCTPEYAGGLPGSFKNLLDWTIGGGEMYGKPVAWLNVSSSAAPTGGAGAHDSLRTVLGYAGSVIVETACARIPLSRNHVGQDGLIADPAVQDAITDSLTALTAAVVAGA